MQGCGAGYLGDMAAGRLLLLCALPGSSLRLHPRWRAVCLVFCDRRSGMNIQYMYKMVKY